MAKHKGKGGGIGLLLLLGAGAFAAVNLFEKGDALRRVSENWNVTGFKVKSLDGLNVVLEVETTFYNTSRQAVAIDSLAMNMRYKGSMLGIVRLPGRAMIASQGPTIVRPVATISIWTLLTKALSLTEATKLVAQLTGKSLADKLKLLYQRAGLKDVTFDGDVVVAGVQKHFTFTADLGNVPAPIKPKLTPAADKTSTTANATA